MTRHDVQPGTADELPHVLLAPVPMFVSELPHWIALSPGIG